MRIFAVIAVLAMGSASFAQKGVQTKRERVTRVDITEDDVVEGSGLSPGDAWIAVRVKARQESLLPIRSHFLREMLREVERM